MYSDKKTTPIISGVYIFIKKIIKIKLREVVSSA
jgi:hypothetical protein